jgi:hypothetical protein
MGSEFVFWGELQLQLLIWSRRRKTKHFPNTPNYFLTWPMLHAPSLLPSTPSAASVGYFCPSKGRSDDLMWDSHGHHSTNWGSLPSFHSFLSENTEVLSSPSLQNAHCMFQFKSPSLAMGALRALKCCGPLPFSLGRERARARKSGFWG